MNLPTIKLTNRVLKNARGYLDKNNYTEIVVPRIVRASGACENINTLFEVSSDNNDHWFNGSKGYLAQTGQLYLEALVPKLQNVYCIGPSFRAEPKVDTRHLTEFLMIEIEHPGGFDQLLQYIEGMIYHLAHTISQDPLAISAYELTDNTITRLANCPKVFTKLTYDEAIQKLIRLGEKIEWGDDITPNQEKILVTKNKNQPLFITRFPDPAWDFKKTIEVEKFFNMLPDAQNPGRVLSADLILPYGGEAVGAAARAHEVEVLIKRLTHSRMFKRLLERGGSMKDFEWYIDQVKTNGAVPHAGCGFGMARVIQWLKGEEDIREAVAFASNKETLI